MFAAHPSSSALMTIQPKQLMLNLTSSYPIDKRRQRNANLPHYQKHFLCRQTLRQDHPYLSTRCCWITSPPSTKPSSRFRIYLLTWQHWPTTTTAVATQVSPLSNQTQIETGMTQIPLCNRKRQMHLPSGEAIEATFPIKAT